MKKESSSFEVSISRRSFIAKGVAVGFAAAVLPISSWAISTSSEGLVSGSILIEGKEGKFPAYWAMPKGKGPFPTILVVHEIFGVHEHIQDVCRRFAKLGFLAVSPYLYSRQGDVTVLKSIDEIRTQVLSKLSVPQVLKDLDQTVEWVIKSKKADSKKIAMTGFCWGGTITWLYAAHQPKLKAGVAWYGRLKGEKSANQPEFPLDIVKGLKAPVLGLYGGKDTGIPLADVEKMREGLSRSAEGSQIVVYPEAEHGFHADYRPSYNEAAAKDGFKKLLNFFSAAGVK